jgi:hypothetical protein
VERFSGQVGGNTSFPVLFLSNKFDPVTPLVNAQSMSKLFPRSSLLVQNAIGVCHSLLFLHSLKILIIIHFQHTTFSATSNCTYQAIRSYVRDGVIPKPGTICDIEDELFPVSNVTEKVQQQDAFDQMTKAYRHFTKKAQAWHQRRRMLL